MGCACSPVINFFCGNISEICGYCTFNRKLRSSLLWWGSMHLVTVSELREKAHVNIDCRLLHMWRTSLWPWFNADFLYNLVGIVLFSLLNVKRPAGGRLNAPPSGFSRIAKKRRRAAPPGFHPPYPPSFPQLLWKFRPKAMWGQVTRSGQVTQLRNNFPITPRLQCFRESYETFGIWWGHQCLQNVNLWFLISVTSGQVIFATSPL